MSLGSFGIGARDDLQDVAAILGGPAQRTDLVHGPGERHRAVAADESIGGTQAGDAAESRGREDRAGGFRAEREGD